MVGTMGGLVLHARGKISFDSKLFLQITRKANLMSNPDPILDFRLEFTEKLKKYSESRQSETLKRLVELLCDAALVQRELISLEAVGMFQFEKSDLYEILEKYIPMFSQFKNLPRLEAGSSYEICIPSSIYTIVTSHSADDKNSD